jgi:hypothetical protein
MLHRVSNVMMMLLYANCLVSFLVLQFCEGKKDQESIINDMYFVFCNFIYFGCYFNYWVL